VWVTFWRVEPVSSIVEGAEGNTLVQDLKCWYGTMKY